MDFLDRKIDLTPDFALGGIYFSTIRYIEEMRKYDRSRVIAFKINAAPIEL